MTLTGKTVNIMDVVVIKLNISEDIEYIYFFSAIQVQRNEHVDEITLTQRSTTTTTCKTFNEQAYKTFG